MAGPYTSILDYLTIENPRIVSPSSARPESNRERYFRPKRVLPWNDFSMSTFAEIYDRQLMEEAKKVRPDFHVPLIHEHECNVHDHNTTLHLIGQWNIAMTKVALNAVRSELHPSTWSGETRPRKEIQEARGEGRQLEADSSTISLCRTCQYNDSRSYWGTRERLPKEIKPFPKFSSTKALSRLDSDGYWTEEAANKGHEVPIKQAYTYCVNNGCRYGCILSASEAFIFRIGPLHKPEGTWKCNTSVRQNQLRR
jgi:hypothetical protein